MSPVGRGKFGYKARALEHFANDSRSGRKGQGTAGSIRTSSLQNPIQVSVTKGRSSFKLGDAFKKTNVVVVKAADLLLKIPKRINTAPYFLGRPSVQARLAKLKDNPKKDHIVPKPQEDRSLTRGLQNFAAGGAYPMFIGMVLLRWLKVFQGNTKIGDFTPEQKTEIKTIYANFPKLKKVIKKLSGSPERKLKLINAVAKNSGDRDARRRTCIFLSLAIEALNQIDGRAEQKLKLLTALAGNVDYSSPSGKNFAFNSLSLGIEALKKIDGSPKQKLKTLTALAKFEQYDVYRNLPETVEALNKTAWSYEQKSQLLIRLAELNGEESNGGIFAMTYRSLSEAISALQKTDWSSDKKYQLLTTVAENARENVYQAYENLHLTIEAVNKIDGSSEQHLNFFTALTEKAGKNVAWFYKHLPKALEALPKIDGKTEQDLKFLLTLAELDYGFSYATLPLALAALKKLGGTTEQHFEFLITLAKKLGGYVSSAYEALPQALEGLNKIDGSLQQKYQFLLTLAGQAGVGVPTGYKALPQAIEALKKMGGRTEQHLKFLTILAEKAGYAFGDSYANLPLAIEALRKIDGTAEQHLKFLTTLAKNAGRVAGYAYEALPQALEALNKIDGRTEQHLKFLTTFAERAGEGVGVGYKALPQVLAALNKIDGRTEQPLELLNTLAEKTGEASGYAYKALPLVLKVLESTDWSFRKKFRWLTSLAEKAGKESFAAAELLHRLQEISPSNTEKSLKDLFRLLDNLSAYNRKRVLETLEAADELLTRRADLEESNFPQHFSLYVTLFERWPRLGLNLLEGVMAATEKGIFPRELGGHREKILHFIEKTHGFFPSIYQVYLKEGDAIFPKLKKYARAILEDRLSLKDIQQLIKQHDELFVLALIQVVAPMSGASFVKRSVQLGFLKKVLKAGDLRGHIPSEWRQQAYPFQIGKGAWVVKEGAKLKPEGELKDLFKQFNPSEEMVQLEQIAKAVDVFYQLGQRSEDLATVQRLLFQYERQKNPLVENFERLKGEGYASLRILEQVLKDTDGIAATLKKVFDDLPAKYKTRKIGNRPIVNLQSLVDQIIVIWSQKKSKERGIEILGSILAPLDPLEITTKLFIHPELPVELREIIQQQSFSRPEIRLKQFIGTFLKKPIKQVETELAKYQYSQTGEVKLELRAVKGVAFGLWGWLAGVCTATDLSVWSNPNFKLLAIFDTAQSKAVGFIQGIETRVGGKKVLTLPGINPTVELLGTVRAKELYPPLMEKIVTMAKQAGYEGVYIPTDAIIHSNRSEFQKAIQKAGYKIKHIPEVNWSSSPSFPFTSVYVVWEKGAEKKN